VSQYKHRRTALQTPHQRHWLWAGSAGLFIAFAILKFSTPAILSELVAAPTSPIEWLFFSWPNLVGYALLAALSITSIRSLAPNVQSPQWLLLIPAVWLGWQVLCTANTINMPLTRATLAHFTSVVLLFYLGYFALSRESELQGFRVPLLGGFLLVLWAGLEQHFGGLQATREMIYSQPNWQELPPEYLEKIAKDRIFSTLFYPNAFAGGLILLTPLAVLFLWQVTDRLQVPSRMVIVSTVAIGALACLIWTESKSGWLVCLALGLVYAFQSQVPKWIKAAAFLVLFVGGLAGFFWKYADYFDKGATSVAARFDYWSAAWNTATSNPLFGSGPGTFMKAYAKIKPPEAEMARLAHNDYLQQASDSGFIGGILYTGFIWSSLFLSWRKLNRSPLRLAVWFGLLGFALQSFVEFGLHIPALAWPFFLLLGWLLGQKVEPVPEGTLA
jgi:hypothetical protein